MQAHAHTPCTCTGDLQAVGRVIRHRRDYGAIILADERFRQPVRRPTGIACSP